MHWPLLEDVLEKIFVPTGYSFRELRKKEVPWIIQALQIWYPDIVVGSESCHLTPTFYEEEVFFRTSGEDRPVWALMFCHGEQVVGFITFQKNADALTLTSRMGAVNPSHRGQGLALAHLGQSLVEALGHQMGAELIYNFVTLKSPQNQLGAEKAGYKLVGIIPAHDRDMVSPGCVKRVYEAIYAKVLVDSGSVLVPPASALTPNTQRLWDFLFKNPAP